MGLQKTGSYAQAPVARYVERETAGKRQKRECKSDYEHAGAEAAEAAAAETAAAAKTKAVERVRRQWATGGVLN